jgi:hypothetical protein
MALPEYAQDTNIIETLGTNPEDRTDLNDQTFKAKFDLNAAQIKAYINATLTKAIDALIAAIKGEGWTSESLKGLADLISTVSGNLTTHQADTVTDSDGAHGLKIEEGNWTPVIAGTTTPGTHTYSAQQGKYYKVGKLVTAFFSITMTAKGGTMAGVASITGLPFTSDNLTYSQGGSITRAGVIDIPTSYNSLALAIPASSNVAYISIIGDGVIADFLTASGIQATTTIAGVLQYKVA